MSWEDRDWAPQGSYGGGRSFADNPLNWAPTIGRVAGIRIRIHITFILFIVFQLLSAGRFAAYWAQFLLVLFGSVFLHELGHCFAARRMRGSATEVLMWPLGGLATVDAPMHPWPQFVTTICGPLVNVVLALVAYLFLQFKVLANPFTFFAPNIGTWSSPSEWLTLTYEINVMLFLFNLWPMYPMDGGRMLKSALWWRMGLQRATLATTTVGMVAAVPMGLYGLATQQYFLLAIAIMGYLACYQERVFTRVNRMETEGFAGYDFSGGYSTLDGGRRPRKEGFVARWRRQRAEAKRREEARRSEHEEREIDRILAKIHQEGIQSLTKIEKRTLEQASKGDQTPGRNRV